MFEGEISTRKKTKKYIRFKEVNKKVIMAFFHLYLLDYTITESRHFRMHTYRSHRVFCIRFLRHSSESNSPVLKLIVNSSTCEEYYMGIRAGYCLQSHDRYLSRYRGHDMIYISIYVDSKQ